jgi:succinate dehydrogenase flavin-adding protein (antitoxin of CptAB toxin-antitoxin module)
LVEITLARLIVFDARRGSEVADLVLTDFTKSKLADINTDIGLTAEEKDLLATKCLIESQI